MRKILSLTILLFIFVFSSTNIFADYTLQIGKFEQEKNALKLKEYYEKKGYQVYMTEGKPYHIVLGRFRTAEESKILQEELKSKDVDFFIKKYEDFTYVGGESEKIKPLETFGPNKDNLYAYNVHPLLNDTNLVGTYAGQSLFFYFNENWKAKNSCYIDLEFSHSQVSEIINSNMIIYLNSKPLKSISLTNDKMENRKVRVYLPSGYIQEGYNNLTLNLYKRMTDLPCEDLFNPANWLRLSQNTNIHIEYHEAKDSTKVEEFPYPYFKVGREDPVDCMIIVPKDANKDQMSAAAYLAFNFGSEEKFKTIKLMAQSGIETNQNMRAYNLILIGEDKHYPNLPSNLKTGLEKDKIVIEEKISPWNQKKKVLRVVAEDKYLKDVVKLLSEEKLIDQMKRSKQIFNAEELKYRIEKLDFDEIYFEDMGYSDVIYRGVFLQSAAFNYELPPGWELKNGAYVDLKFRFSEAIDFEKSTISADINGIPIGSKRLIKENANKDSARFFIPEELLDAKNLNLNVSFYFDMRNIDCKKRYSDQAWGVVTKDSRLYLPHRSDSGDLEAVPGVFFEGSKLKNTAIVLPEEHSNYDLENTLRIYSYLGHFGSRIEDSWIIGEKDVEDFKDYNLIIYGTPDGNEIIKDLNDKLWVKYDYSTGHFVPNEDFVFVRDLSNESGMLQMMESPYKDDKTLLMVTSESKSLLSNATKLLSELNYSSQKEGVVSILDDYNEVFNYQRPGIAGLENVKKPKDKKTFIGGLLADASQRSMIIVGVLFLFISIALVLGWTLYKKTKK